MQLSLNRPGIRFFKPLVFVLCLLPFAWLLLNAFSNQLGADPTKVMVRTLGDWAIYFLLIGLAISPARKLAGKPWLIRYRRMIGLFAFFYASMHFLAYIWFDQYFDVSEIIEDIIKRPFITIGFVNLLMLLALAATSNKYMIKRLKQNWLRLHKLVYPIAMLALLHFFMMIKADYSRPGVLLIVLSVLLGYRLIPYFRLAAIRARAGIKTTEGKGDVKGTVPLKSRVPSPLRPLPPRLPGNHQATSAEAHDFAPIKFPGFRLEQ